MNSDTWVPRDEFDERPFTLSVDRFMVEALYFEQLEVWEMLYPNEEDREWTV